MTKSKSKPVTPKAQPAETKKDRLIALLRREGGATISDIAEALAWLPHTTRAMLTGLRKEGLVIAKTSADGVSRYSIMSEPAA